MKETIKIGGGLLFTLLLYWLKLDVTTVKLTTLSSGLGTFDMAPIFDGEYAVGLLEYLESDGRAYYLFRHLPLDLLHTIVFALAFFNAFSYLTAKPKRAKYRFIRFLPLMAAVFGITENITVAVLLYSFPTTSFLVLLPWFTLMEIIFSVLCLLVLLLLGGCCFVGQNQKRL